MEPLSGEMEADMMDNSKTITLKDSAIIFGLMKDNMKEFGKTTK